MRDVDWIGGRKSILEPAFQGFIEAFALLGIALAILLVVIIFDRRRSIVLSRAMTILFARVGINAPDAPWFPGGTAYASDFAKSYGARSTAMKNFPCIEDLRQQARRNVPKMFFDYAEAGSYAQETLRANRADFEQIKLRQRVLVDVSGRDTSTTILGEKVPLPFALRRSGSAA